MNHRIESSRIFYSFTFDPPLAAHADEYHSLSVELSQPALTADTAEGYYDQPFYDDPLDPTIQRVTVLQLEQILQTTHGGTAARQLSHIVLTERMSQRKLQSLLAELHDKKLRASLQLIADASTFLRPPSAELSADSPPDQAEQRRILKAAADYLDRVIPRLPDFSATRTAVYYREVAPYPGVGATDAPEALHADRQLKETVLYRKGEEAVESASPHTGTEVLPLRAYGSFGPVLSLLQLLLKSTDDVAWDSWVQSSDGRRAVFRYRLADTPALTLSGCCFPNGGKGARVVFAAPSQGKFVIDPGSGAILRVQTEFDLSGFVGMRRSDIMLSYGPVEIGRQNVCCPASQRHAREKPLGCEARSVGCRFLHLGALRNADECLHL